ncbi:hypothetical protein ACFX5U_15435 [Sphingobacterium sp. SG20118]|uniref:hypothetical protein n=1 Tax=Sphingobacterium sp. SG20118 TaxID=3367156 RepID=UPI0037DFC366
MIQSPVSIAAIYIVDKAYLFDNSCETMVLIAEVIKGQLEILVPGHKLPSWFIEHVVNKL